MSSTHEFLNKTTVHETVIDIQQAVHEPSTVVRSYCSKRDPAPNRFGYFRAGCKTAATREI
jgi:hypothetical protein